ncbi:hypothetical protein ACH5RR_040561 [Cinchona calisaya]|uniref:Uncharacterized protein n=1 Tax=Cinchona calisaya TaxID=153742 RepID=A0ABD2XUD2_9GENT
MDSKRIRPRPPKPRALMPNIPAIDFINQNYPKNPNSPLALPAPSTSSLPRPLNLAIQPSSSKGLIMSTSHYKEPASYIGAVQNQVPIPRTPDKFQASPSTQNPSINSPSSSPTSSSQSQYVLKDYVKPLIFLEQGHTNSSFKELFDIYFSPVTDIFAPSKNWFIQEVPRKTRQYYEFILIDTKCVNIEHIPEEEERRKQRLSKGGDSNVFYNYSKIKIKKILKPSDWPNSNYNTQVAFTVQWTPPSYNYYDYIKAWQFAFLCRPFNHSWFIQFDKDLSMIPRWFYDWWDDFGANAQILPPNYYKEFIKFCQQNSREINDPTMTLQFFKKHKLPFIMAWNFNKTDVYGLPNLSREYRIKWWNTIKDLEETCSSPIQASEFFSTKSKFQSMMASTSSKEEFKKQLQDALSQISEEEDNNSTQKDDQDPFYQNEDDCYGIFSPIP